MLLGSFCDPDLDGVDYGQCTIAVINDFDRIVYTGYDNSRHIRAVVAVDRFCASTPDKQSALDGNIIERDFSIRCAAADDKVAAHGHVFQFNVSSANQYAALDVLVVVAFCGDVRADNVMENLP